MCNSCSLTLSNRTLLSESFKKKKEKLKKKKMTVHTFQTCSSAPRIKYKTNEKQTERMEGMMVI